MAAKGNQGWFGRGRGNRNTISLLLTASGLVIGSSTGRGAAGDLDTTFGGSGMIRFGFGGTDDDCRAIALQPDGKVVMAGTISYRFALARFGTNNVLDPTFGSGGLVFGNFPPNPIITAVDVQPDGKIVVAGWVFVTASQNYDFLVARFNADGTPDPSFGSGGVTFRSYGDRDECEALLIQSDGKIVLAGTTSTLNPYRTFMVIARLHPNGSPDTSFDGDGALVETDSSWAYSLAQQPDGKLLVGGQLGPRGMLRLNANGTPDTTFGTNGIVAVDAHITAIAIQPGDGSVARPDRIVAAGGASVDGQGGVRVARISLSGKLDTTFNDSGVVSQAVGDNVSVTGLSAGFVNRFFRQILVTGFYRNGTTRDFMLVRFTDSGNIDNAFGNGGIVTQSLSPGNDEATGMVIQPGLKVLLAGTGGNEPYNHDFALARFNWSDGSLDTTFHETGLLLQNMADLRAAANAVAIQNDGKILAAGICGKGFDHAASLCRLNPDGTLDPAFGTGGRVITTAGNPNSAAQAIAIQPDGKILVAGKVYDPYRDSVMLARYLPNGALDSAFGTNGIVITVTVPNSASAHALALQPDGKIVVGVRIRQSDLDFAVYRYLANGPLDNTWNGNGQVITGVGPDEDELHAVAIQADGKIIAAGGSFFPASAKFSAVRYNTNGSLDASFGSFGRVATQLGTAIADMGYGLTLQPNGKILQGGFTAGLPTYQADVGVVRYNINGTLDTTFDGDGITTTPIGLSDDYAFRITLQRDGKIVAGCRTKMGTHFRFAVTRFSPNGSLDTPYGSGAVNFFEFGTAADEILNDMALDAEDRIVMVGEVGGIFGILRVQSDPTLRFRSITRVGNGHILLRGQGVPNGTHTLLKSATLASGTFSLLGPVTADASGDWDYEDATGSAGTPRFYRFSFP